ncbi:MAG TPA: glutamate-cysteine ligase family protein, partial [Gemmatimonadaceae bacterium]
MATSFGALLAQLRHEAFGAGASSAQPLVGAEVELIPVVSGSGRIAAIDDCDRPSTLPLLREAGRRMGWRELRSSKAGVPELRLPHGGRITFEPGGQIEYSAPPRPSVSALAADLRDVAERIREAVQPTGIELETVGIDPINVIDDVPLQLTAPRYRRMDAHFATIGPYGARMMRQTASIQICLDAGPDPLARWRLLNALAPYLVAIFANSPTYAGAPTGHRSVRRFIWGALDPARTGLPWDAAHPEAAYADFALNAAALLGAVDEPPFPTFGEWWSTGSATLEDWRAHLTTLFPEVRPRGYFEVRSIDALEPAAYAVPLVLLASLVLDPAVAESAAELAGTPNPALLERAGRCGLTDPSVARSARELVSLAMRGAESLGPAVIAPDDLRTAEEWFERYTLRS